MTNDLTAAVAELPEGPQIAGYTCLGCRHFQSEYWREPSGDGETWDSGTSADCRLIGKNISTYFGSEPHVPDWCPKPASGALVPAADVQGLVEAVKALNAACDAMWNDHARLEPNPSRFGQKYRLKEAHMRAISEAQQKLPDALTEWEGI